MYESFSRLKSFTSLDNLKVLCTPGHAATSWSSVIIYHPLNLSFPYLNNGWTRRSQSYSHQFATTQTRLKSPKSLSTTTVKGFHRLSLWKVRFRQWCEVFPAWMPCQSHPYHSNLGSGRLELALSLAGKWTARATIGGTPWYSNCDWLGQWAGPREGMM